MTKKSLTYSEPLIFEPKTKPTYSVIWLHGLGADGYDFEGIVPYLNHDDIGARLIFPHAPKRHVTVNNNLVMRAWYDIATFDFRDEDSLGIECSSDYIHRLIDKEVESGIAPDHIFLIGFSQGGSMAIYSGLRYRHKLAGIVGLSCYLLKKDSYQNLEVLNVPIWMGHGTQDPVVDYSQGKSCADFLKTKGYSLSFYDYVIGHELSHEEILELVDWLNEVIG